MSIALARADAQPRHRPPLSRFVPGGSPDALVCARWRGASTHGQHAVPWSAACTSLQRLERPLAKSGIGATPLDAGGV